MTKQEYVVFWHADYADYADSFCICGICEICVENSQGSCSRHLLSKLCDSLMISISVLQCGCPYGKTGICGVLARRLRRFFLYLRNLRNLRGK